MRRIDPVTFEVIWHRLLDTTEEMGIKYMRTSGSPILMGAYDASTGITLKNGELVAMGPYITTQAHVLPLIIQSVIEHAATNPGINRGDMFICNDPYLGATHQPDVATVAPVYDEDRLIAWVGASGHWLDIGGPEPGGFTMTARSVFEEGLRMPPTRLVEGGDVREDIVSLIMNQVRDPLAELDLRGQIVANQAGAARLQGLFDQFGAATVQRVMEEGIDHVERRLRTRLRELPDGVWREIQYIDHDGHEARLRKIVCTATKRGGELTLDFGGTDPQADGFANCTFGGLRAATLSAVSILLAYDLAWNEGVARCVDIVAPQGTSCTATYPAPVSGATISAIILTLNLVFSVISKMLLSSSDLVEEAMANWCGTSVAPSVIGLNESGVMTVYGETSHFGAGCGARTYRDGVDTGGIIINTTASIPSIEVVESEYPILNLFRRQLVDSGGAGRFRGGMAGEVALIPYDTGGPLEASFAGFGAEVPNAFGTGGGMPGAAARYIRFAETSIPELMARGAPLPAYFEEIDGTKGITQLNSSHSPFGAEMVEYHNWQGGGGYGDPLDRDPDLVARDYIEQRVSKQSVKEHYGVVLSGDGTVDQKATEQLRKTLLTDRKERAHPARHTLQDSDWDHLGSWIDDMTGSGSVTYADTVLFDFETDAASCVRCGYVLGPARERFQDGALVEELPVGSAGPVRGEDYDSGRVRLLLFYCPGCGRQLECTVTILGAPQPGFRLAPESD